MLPSDYVIGTLLSNAVGSRNYEYLTALLKKMMHLEVAPNDTMLKKLETAAQHKPRVSRFLEKLIVFVVIFPYVFVGMQDARQARRLDGFRGFYKIWKGVMVPQDDKEENMNYSED